MSNELPWKIWTPDDLAPPLAEFVPMEHSDEPAPEEGEPEISEEQQLEQQLAQLKIQAHEQGYNAGLAEGRKSGHEQGYQEGLAQGLNRASAGARPAGTASCADAAAGQRVSAHAGRAGQRDCLAPDADGAGGRASGNWSDARGG